MAHHRKSPWMDGLTLAHPYHERKSCSKFSSILPSGLGGDSVTEGYTDAGQMDGKIMLLLNILNIRGSDLTSLVKFHQVV